MERHLRGAFQLKSSSRFAGADKFKSRFIIARDSVVIEGGIPFGYHRSLGEHYGLDKRDIDVLFLGSLNNKRRKTLLHNLSAELIAKGVELKIVERDCYGDSITDKYRWFSTEPGQGS